MSSCDFRESRLLAFARRVRQNRVAKSSQLVREIQAQYRDLLREGPVEVWQVKPVARLCKSREEFRLFTYSRLLQSVPTSPLIGRRMAFLVFDEGGRRPRLIGSFGFNSSPYSLRARDEFLRWTDPSSGKRKDLGLQCVMDMPVCVALRPYSSVLGGKLVAAMALSEDVNREYVER
jgi:hypothetical protein